MPNATSPAKISIATAVLGVFAAPFKRGLDDERLSKRRRVIDPLLTIILSIVVLVYAVFEGLQGFDAKAFASVCYSTAEDLPGGDAALKVKHLCYTKEVDEAWQQFALKTYTCRGEFGGTTWGVIAGSGGGGPTPTAPAAAGGGPAPSSSPGAPPGAPTPAAPGGGGAGPSPPRSRALQGASSGTFVTPDVNPEFCSQVIHSGESEMKAFVEKSMHDSCIGGGCQAGVDTSVVYAKMASGGSTAGQYYLQNLAAQPEGFTCCGMRFQSWGERLMAWLGAVGGFWGLAHALLMWVPPFSAGDEENAADAENREKAKKVALAEAQMVTVVPPSASPRAVVPMTSGSDG